MNSIAIRVQGPERDRDLRLCFADGEVSTADVLDALALPPSATVDGFPIGHRGGRAVDELHDGSIVSTWQPVPPLTVEPQPVPPVLDVAVVGGLDSGARVALGPGRYRLAGDLTTSPASVADGWYLDVDEVDDLRAMPWHLAGSSTEARPVDDAVLALSRPVAVEPSVPGHVHRPPRPLGAEAVDPVMLEEPPAAPPPPAPLSWATLLAPIPIAVVMALVFRPLFALFALIGPTVSLARWFEGRRRFRSQTRRRDASIAAMAASVAILIGRQGRAEVMRRWQAQPHVAELWRRARCHSVRLWERRPGTPGYLQATVGIGPDRWFPLLQGAAYSNEAHGSADQPIPLRGVPHTVDMTVERGIGVHGPRDAALAIVRSLVLQLATLHGPADVIVGVVASRGATGEWDWLKWLPHLDRDLVGPGTTALRVAAPGPRQDPSAIEARRFGQSKHDVGPVVVMIVDDPATDIAALTRMVEGAGRELRVVALAQRSTLLPSVCTALVSVTGSGAELAAPSLLVPRVPVVPVGVSAATAASWARSLAPMRDPELVDPSPAIDHELGFADLYSSADLCPTQLIQEWTSRRPGDPVVVPIGRAGEQVVTVDLDHDGPHALVAGTTGSGKSELLRTLALGLAATCSPHELNLVLVDFKGGGAFDACGELPHVAGVITDLDESLVERAIQSLRAEIHRRETLFRSVGACEWADAAHKSDEPLPRVVLIIDEFAVLAADHAPLMAGIVDLAARGRSLGLHLVLATQRPSGVVDQKIRANTNLRIALRVQDPYDSTDVVGTPDASTIDRRRPGRAIMSVGGDRPQTIQTAWTGGRHRPNDRCRVEPLQLFDDGRADGSEPTHPGSERTELAATIEAIGQAAATAGLEAGRLWVDPLPDTVVRASLDDRPNAGAARGAVGVTGLGLGLVDLPRQQAQLPWRWLPESGSIGYYTGSADDAGRFLCTVAAAIAEGTSPAVTHLYSIDGGAGEISAIDGLAHVGAHIESGDIDRVDRVVQLVEAMVAARRSSGSGGAGGTRQFAGPQVILLIDNLAAMLDWFDDLARAEMVDRLAALVRDGAPRGVAVILTARTARDVPHRLAQHLAHRLVGGLADPTGHLMLGLSNQHPPPTHEMRVVHQETGQVIQLAVSPDLADLGARSRLEPVDEALRPVTIGRFPDFIDGADLAEPVLTGHGLAIPIGVSAVDLEPVALHLGPGDHALVLGRPGSGRSNALHLLADQVRRLGDDRVEVFGVARPGSPLVLAITEERRLTSADQIDALDAGDRNEPIMVLVDDADLLDEPIAEALRRLIEGASTTVQVIAATTPDHARSMRSWLAPIQARGTGVILAAESNDGALLQARIEPLAGVNAVPGRSHLVRRGRSTGFQMAYASATECESPQALTTLLQGE